MLRVKTIIVLAVRYLFLTRYSWLSAIVLVMLVPSSLVGFPQLLANLFVFDLPEQIYHVSWLAMWCALTVMETLRVTTLNAHLRFDDYRLSVRRFRQVWNVEEGDAPEEWYRTSGGWSTFALGLVAALAVWHLIVDACITQTVADYSRTWETVAGAESAADVRSICWARAIAGLATTMILLGVLNGILILFHERQKRLEANDRPSDDQPPWQRSLYGVLHFVLGPGYFRQQQRSDPRQTPILHFAPGHLRLLLYTVTFMIWHLVNYVSARSTNVMPTETSPYPALFYGLLTLLVFLYVLPGAAFYWDRYRIPVPLLMLGSVLILYTAFGTDHYYELNPPPRRPEAYAPPTLEKVYDDWEFPYDIDGTRTLVVVDASGGGIQASAWTAQVLTGLHQRYGDDFSQSVGLISGVSGGSVGTMFYLANRADVDEDYDPDDENVELLSEEAVRRIREVSRSSALEATAWGIAYPDLMRLVFAPVANPKLDRGWATEQVWRQRMTTADKHSIDHSDLRLSDLEQACRVNQLPIPVFNATLMESGQRLQISPVLGPTTVEEPPASAVQFMNQFRDAHLRVSTAARLSATFPYVSPASRSNETGPDPVTAYHVVDGAYVDNEGAVTSVDWIQRLLTYYSDADRILDRPFDRILLIRIQAFPKRTSKNPGPKVEPASGWRSALAGPLEAMLRVRSTSQTERGDLEISLLTEANREHVVAARDRYEAKLREAEEDVRNAEQELAAAEQLGEGGADATRRQAQAYDKLRFARSYHAGVRDRMYEVDNLQLVSVLFDFHSPSPVMIPLSWKLTESQKRNIDEAWEVLVAGKHPHNPIAVLDQYFMRIDDEPAESETEVE